MGEDEQGLFDPANPDPDNELMVELLMGWDGDPCECRICDCPNFRVRPDSDVCDS